MTNEKATELLFKLIKNEYEFLEDEAHRAIRFRDERTAAKFRQDQEELKELYNYVEGKFLND